MVLIHGQHPHHLGPPTCLVAAPGLEVLGGMAGSGGLLEPSGLDPDAAASDVAGMALICWTGTTAFGSYFVADALAVVLLDLASALALGMEMLDASAAPAVGMVLLLDTSASWFHAPTPRDLDLGQTEVESQGELQPKFHASSPKESHRRPS